MKLVYIVMGTYQENSGPKFSLIAKCDILTVTESPKWADHVINTYKTDYDNVYYEEHYIE